MPYFTLKQKLHEVRKPTKEFWHRFERKLYQRQYSRKEIWLAKGNIGKKIAFLGEGGAISYVKKNDKNVVNRLWLPNEFILSPSVFTHQPSEQTIEFRKESHVIQFSIEAIQQLRKAFDEASFYIDYFLGMEMRSLEEHIVWLKSFISQKRHDDSMKKYGALYSDLTNTEKGTFLGISEKRVRDIL